MTPLQPLAYNEFTIGAVLTITCGSASRIFCTYEESMEILGYMNHQVPHPADIQASIDSARPAVIEQYPKLDGMMGPPLDITETGILAWLKKQEEAFGATLELEPLAVTP